MLSVTDKSDYSVQRLQRTALHQTLNQTNNHLVKLLSLDFLRCVNC